MSRSFANVADDKRFRSIRLKDRKDDRLNIINYQSHHYWQESSSAFVRYDSDFDNDSATFAAKLIIDLLFTIHILKKDS